jgi:hypothetical protein
LQEIVCGFVLLGRLEPQSILYGCALSLSLCIFLACFPCAVFLVEMLLCASPPSLPRLLPSQSPSSLHSSHSSNHLAVLCAVLFCALLVSRRVQAAEHVPAAELRLRRLARGLGHRRPLGLRCTHPSFCRCLPCRCSVARCCRMACALSELAAVPCALHLLVAARFCSRWFRAFDIRCSCSFVVVRLRRTRR